MVEMVIDFGGCGCDCEFCDLLRAEQWANGVFIFGFFWYHFLCFFWDFLLLE